MEEIDKKLPGFIAGLVKHPGIGYLLVDPSKYGPIIFGKKGKYYLKNDEEREMIAKAGYERTLKEHTYLQRFEEIFKKIGL